MGHRLSKISTRTGDTGTTGLATGLRVENDCLVPFRNRLSDLLFVVARVLNKAERNAEPMWRPRG